MHQQTTVAMDPSFGDCEGCEGQFGDQGLFCCSLGPVVVQLRGTECGGFPPKNGAILWMEIFLHFSLKKRGQLVFSPTFLHCFTVSFMDLGWAYFFVGQNQSRWPNCLPACYQTFAGLSCRSSYSPLGNYERRLKQFREDRLVYRGDVQRSTIAPLKNQPTTKQNGSKYHSSHEKKTPNIQLNVLRM